MDYRQLGASGITLPAIGFGCGGTARLMVGDDHDLRLETVRLALDNGINYFDTAAAYGDGRSEINLGRTLRELGADAIISDKVVLQWEDLDDPRSSVLRNFDQGMERLGRDGVDALMLHNRVFTSVEPGSQFRVGASLDLNHIFGPNGVAEAFAELKASGRVKAVGFTAFGGEPAAISQLISSGSFDALNASFSLLNLTAVREMPPTFDEDNYEQVISEAIDADLGVMIIQALAKGDLTGSGPASGIGARIAAMAPAYDSSLVSLAIRYILGRLESAVIILGLSEPSHVQDAVAAVQKGPLGSDAIEQLEQVVLEEAARSTGQ